jgi:creatinine amidohydrolase
MIVRTEMRLSLTAVIAMALGAAALAEQQSFLPTQYEELAATDMATAVEKSGGVCVVPIGILEKHGPHLPLGTDLLDARQIALRAARQEYTTVFPQYYFGQILEARHQPGTIAYSPGLIWQALDETCSELARNGFKKIVLVNGHGGNNNFLSYFCQAQLEKRHDYVVVLFQPGPDPETEAKARSLRKSAFDAHAGETETSTIMAHRPDLVRADRAGSQSGADQARLKDLPHVYTGIWWYARFPNHYAGDGSFGSAELGALLLDSQAKQLVELLKALKTDDSLLKLQDQFYSEGENPLGTKQ